MALSSIWWLMAGIAVIAELLTGTLYLLMVAIGLAAAAIAAHLGAGETLQVVVAAAVSGATVLACYLRQKRLGALHIHQHHDQFSHLAGGLDVGKKPVERLGAAGAIRGREDVGRRAWALVHQTLPGAGVERQHRVERDPLALRGGQRLLRPAACGHDRRSGQHGAPIGRTT